MSDRAGEFLVLAPGEDYAAFCCEEAALVLGDALREGRETPPVGILPQHLGLRVPAGRATGHPDPPALVPLERDERGRAAGCGKTETPGDPAG